MRWAIEAGEDPLSCQFRIFYTILPLSTVRLSFGNENEIKKPTKSKNTDTRGIGEIKKFFFFVRDLCVYL